MSLVLPLTNISSHQNFIYFERVVFRAGRALAVDVAYLCKL
jgi:hypothetical protein